MATVRIDEGTRNPFPWRRAALIGGWALSVLIVAGVLGWLLWESRNENAALTAAVARLESRIDALIQQHAAQIAALEQQHDAELDALIQRHTDRIAALMDERTALEELHAEQVAQLNSEIAVLEQRSAALLAQLTDCQDNVAGLVQRGDRLEAELDACLIELNQPRRLQVVLPALLRDNTTSIFVVDDSGSMVGNITKVRESMQEVRDKAAANAQLSIILFGDSYTTLFNFTDPANAPWDYALGEFKAAHGGTDINLALQAAFDSIKDEPDPSKRIVLLTDGHGFINAETLVEIQNARIPVDTIAFGALADHRLLAQVARDTDGDFLVAN